MGLTFEEKNAWERKTEREFAMWAKHCDAREQTDFYGVQALAYYEKLLYGDAFVNLPLLFNRTDKNPYPLRLQIVESILVASPPKYTGREEDENNDVIHGVKSVSYTHLEIAIQRIIDHTHYGLLLDMGLGKTISTLIAIEQLMYDYFDIKKVLLIAPKKVAESTWAQETQKWSETSHLTIA